MLSSSLITQFFEENSFPYRNKNLVEIEYRHEILVSISLKNTTHNFGHINLFINDVNQTVSSFIEKYNIQNLSDIENISIHEVTSLYEQGVADVHCILSSFHAVSLQFKKIDSKMYALDDFRNQHEVYPTITDYDDFVLHTMSYFNISDDMRELLR